ncbi:MAG: site-specific DNA-methyltransferase [Spirulina sp. SIO3F2]|nr:site-specific DNA-methyltransferase [Spirulina sp. SIO3F2]
MSPRKSTKKQQPKQVKALKHDDATRKNIPTAEHQSVMATEEQSPIRVAYERRNRDLDPQLVWRGKDEQDWSDLVVSAPPLYIQEKVKPKVLIDDLMQRTESRQPQQLDLFADFNGLPQDATATDFYQHDAHWTNRMILGDSLQVMASLAEREGLRGKVQCIYLDPPYGIKFNSNFQWSTTSRDVKDGKVDHITREPEQVKAFRDTWRDGIHSYLTYLRDRLTVARDLLTESGSIFVQIGDENVHRVRALMDEVFGDENFCGQITIKKTSVSTGDLVASINDYLVWYCKHKEKVKFSSLFYKKEVGGEGTGEYRYLMKSDGLSRSLTKEELLGVKRLPDDTKIFRPDNLTSSHEYSEGKIPFQLQGRKFYPGSRYWSTSPNGMLRLAVADRLIPRRRDVAYKRFLRVIQEKNHPLR